MKRTIGGMIACLLIVVFGLIIMGGNASAQKKPGKAAPSPEPKVIGSEGVVVDDRLSALRSEPKIYASLTQRLRIGASVSISDIEKADGIVFYQVTVSPTDATGWIQAEAVASAAKPDEDRRLLDLVQSFEGPEQMEVAMIFMGLFPKSPLLPPILLLIGDIAEEKAFELSAEAAEKLRVNQMAASRAPLHSFYLNYAGLDRYRRLGLIFVFNPDTKQLHYDGAAWEAIRRDFPKSDEAAEAKTRLDSLREKMKPMPKKP